MLDFPQTNDPVDSRFDVALEFWILGLEEPYTLYWGSVREKFGEDTIERLLIAVYNQIHVDMKPVIGFQTLLDYSTNRISRGRPMCIPTHLLKDATISIRYYGREE